MFKILILQRLYNLSDEQVEFQINDRQSFQRFLGLHLGHAVPDFSTVWLFREALTEAEAIKPLFDTYAAILSATFAPVGGYGKHTQRTRGRAWDRPCPMPLLS